MPIVGAMILVSISQRSCTKDLIPKVELLGGAMDLYEVGPQGRSLGH
jgi:hypothetical protein